MPIFRFPYDQKEENRLEVTGPVISVVISLPESLAKLRLSKGQQVPAGVRGKALIDTGASASALDLAVFESLSIREVDSLPLRVAGGIAQMGVFPASLSFPELKIPQLEMERVIGCRLGWKSEKDDGFLMLLGRDILRNFLFIYDGVHDELIIGH